MLIEDESVANTIFARARLSFDCEAKMLTEVSEEIFDKFYEIHDSKMVSMFRKMDFDMFELDIKVGRLVKGFGQAFEVSEEIFDKFYEIHDSKMVSMFRKMDFDMFELDIKVGRLVKGFGQAFEIKFVNGEIQSTQVTGAGETVGHGISKDSMSKMMNRDNK